MAGWLGVYCDWEVVVLAEQPACYVLWVTLLCEPLPEVLFVARQHERTVQWQ